ncbi:MEX3D protein, partial [Chloropsis hardwickii]|nr:MEX3D protein [Chloropsis hardwickii]
GCKIKALRAKTNTYIKTPVRGEEPVFIVTGRKEDVEMAKREILSAAEHFSMIRATRNKVNGLTGAMQGPPNLPGQTTIQVRVPYRVVGLVSFYSGRVAAASPTSPYSTFSEPPAPLGSDECDFGFDFLALDLTTPTTTIWSPFERSGNPLQAFSSCSSINSSQRRNSGPATPRHSPTLPESGAAGLEHPSARRIPSDPAGALAWLPAQGSLSSFSNSTGYSSSSSLPGSISAASGSPTDSSSSDGHRKSSRECMVCLESEVMAALVPCGHNLFCMECALRICGRAQPQCPACHVPATQAIHIFS